ncbi:hypothetical protein [Bacillus thuringiensis]|uniref:hypothetical protein n=1 Tax=Bacillus thuringiensis TaxID=1428 RepID=UPI001596DB19|nr:hypothetical protein [Bacillus thuringiensis]
MNASNNKNQGKVVGKIQINGKQFLLVQQTQPENTRSFLPIVTCDPACPLQI